MKRPEVLGIIMARGGSKGVPRKSIALVSGIPLLGYTVEAAKRSQHITRLIISTDDEEMAEVAKRYGAEAPFLRPKELAGDDVLDLPVIEHALDWLKEHESYEPDIVVHLRPTTPLKKAVDIDRGIELLLEREDADSVRSVCSPAHTPFKMYREVAGSPFLEPLLKGDYPEVYATHPEPFNMPRQHLPSVWRHSGYVDVIRVSTIRGGSISGTRILPLPFESWRDIDIDTPRDLAAAELVIQDLREKGTQPWD